MERSSYFSLVNSSEASNNRVNNGSNKNYILIKQS